MEPLIYKVLERFVPKVFPPFQRYCTYIFVVLGIIWLVGGNYYYFTDEADKCFGSLVSGLIFLVLALITHIWERSIVEEELKENIVNNLLSGLYPVIGFKALGLAKDLVLSKHFTKICSFGFTAVGAYLLLKNKYLNKNN